MALALPEAIRGCLFDMDGVLTRTASVHEAAWKDVFDEVLRSAGQRPFTHEDYLRHVDGRAREDGTRGFLGSRGIRLPEGVDDDRDLTTVRGVSNRKNEALLHRLAVDGVATYDDAVDLVHAARRAGLKTAVVSASANTAQVLDAAGLTGSFDGRVDGVVAAAQHLAGKPAADMFLAAATQLDLAPAACAVFEDALSGVAAGRAGRFGLVVGVDRADQADALRDAGADVVVADLHTLLGAPA